MKKITLRIANKNDIPRLITLENESFTTDQLERRHFSHLLKSQSAKIYVATHKKEILGCIILLFRKNSNHARLYSLVVNPEYRRLGIAKRLCLLAENMAKRKRCIDIILEVRTDNTPAIRFYKKQGYETFGKYENFYEDGTDGWRMKKKLLRTPLEINFSAMPAKAGIQ